MARYSFFVVEKLGPKQSLTPEGFLLCEEVPLARTGMMVYGPGETPIEPGPDGITKIFREPEDVFSPETLASAQGKSVTNDHPDEDVVPENWKELTHGFMFNVRQGEGSQDDLMIGDLLVTTPEAITAIREEGKVEVSLGYDAEYEETGPGMGKQKNLLINHIALVVEGRCGPRCAIKDSKSSLNGSNSMPVKSTKDKKSLIKGLLDKAFKAKDAAEVEALQSQIDEALESGPESSTGDIHIHLPGATPAADIETGIQETDDDEGATGEGDQWAKNAQEHEEFRTRLQALEELVKTLTAAPAADAEGEGEGENTSDSEEEEEGKGTADEAEEKEIQDEVPEELKEEASKAKDSAFLQDSFQDTVAMAEILVPGIRIPTFDSSVAKKNSFKVICGLRKLALDSAYATADGKAIIDDVLGGKTFDSAKMSTSELRSLFRSAASTKRAINNRSVVKQSVSVFNAKDQSAKPQGVKTLADLNKRYAEVYKI